MKIALILSGGTGTRLGGAIPKQYIKVGGKPVLLYSLATLAAHPAIDVLWIVAAYEWQGAIVDWIHDAMGAEDGNGERDFAGGWQKFRGFSLPGINRQLSILNGLEEIRKFASGDDYVLVHDGARPMVSASLVTEVFNAAEGHDGTIPVLPVKDTLYFSGEGKQITSLLDRSSIYAGQAPEVFRLGKYYEANRRLLPEEIMKINGSTEPAVMAGMDMVMIPGEEGNFKITTEADLEKFQEIVVRRYGT